MQVMPLSGLNSTGGDASQAGITTTSATQRTNKAEATSNALAELAHLPDDHPRWKEFEEYVAANYTARGEDGLYISKHVATPPKVKVAKSLQQVAERFFAERATSSAEDEEEYPADHLPDFSTLENLESEALSPEPGTIAYFEKHATPEHYPEATQFFATTEDGNAFVNPFDDVGSERARESSVSPHDRASQAVNAKNGIDYDDEPFADPSAPLPPPSKYYPVVTVGPIPLHKRRNYNATVSSNFPMQIDSATLNAGSSNSELHAEQFSNTLLGFLADMDVSSLISDYKSEAYNLVSHDLMKERLGLDPDVFLLNPHGPDRDCTCGACQEFYYPDEIQGTHAPDERCRCKGCARYEFQIQLDQAVSIWY